MVISAIQNSVASIGARFGNMYLLSERSPGIDKDGHPTFPKSQATIKFLQEVAHRNEDVWVGESWWKNTEDGNRPRFVVTTGRDTITKPWGRDFGDARNDFANATRGRAPKISFNDPFGEGTGKVDVYSNGVAGRTCAAIHLTDQPGHVVTW